MTIASKLCSVLIKLAVFKEIRIDTIGFKKKRKLFVFCGNTLAKCCLYTTTTMIGNSVLLQKCRIPTDLFMCSENVFDQQNDKDLSFHNSYHKRLHYLKPAKHAHLISLSLSLRSSGAGFINVNINLPFPGFCFNYFSKSKIHFGQKKSSLFGNF